jgi:hypothetical protein
VVELWPKGEKIILSDSPDDGDEGSEPTRTSEFDRYRSLADPTITIFVPSDVVPFFRFKAGGWELLQSSAEIGSAMKARIAENGFFMFRINDDQTGGVELTDLPGRSQSGIVAE